MRLLILGGTAWLGHELARTARDRGWAVTCLARGTAGPPVEGVELVAADRTVKHRGVVIGLDRGVVMSAMCPVGDVGGGYRNDGPTAHTVNTHRSGWGCHPRALIELDQL